MPPSLLLGVLLAVFGIPWLPPYYLLSALSSCGGLSGCTSVSQGLLFMRTLVTLIWVPPHGSRTSS